MGGWQWAPAAGGQWQWAGRCEERLMRITSHHACARRPVVAQEGSSAGATAAATLMSGNSTMQLKTFDAGSSRPCFLPPACRRRRRRSAACTAAITAPSAWTLQGCVQAARMRAPRRAQYPEDERRCGWQEARHWGCLRELPTGRDLLPTGCAPPSCTSCKSDDGLLLLCRRREGEQWGMLGHYRKTWYT